MATARLDPNPVGRAAPRQVYEKREWTRGYGEEDTLGGRELQSSKRRQRSEQHYRRSFSPRLRLTVASARAETSSARRRVTMDLPDLFAR